MKFKQALRAMRRGEKVKRKSWTGPCRYGLDKDGIILSSHSATFYTNAQELSATDWVIVRKKKKTPPPRFSEDELEPVGTLPRVGDVLWIAGQEKYGDHDYYGPGFVHADETLEMRGDRFGTKNGRGTWSADEIAGNVRYCFRLLKRPPEALRDVFKDPRVGDVVRGSGSGCTTVTHVCVGTSDADYVDVLWVEDGKVAPMARRTWSMHQVGNCKYEVFHRAP